MSEAIPGMQEAPPPAEPKDAAVVVLVRMGPRGLETFWLRRERTVSFAAGFYAFPGGRVDAGDAEVPIEGAGPPDSRLVAAAARELFEETGPLDFLFVPTGGAGLLSGCAIAARALSPDIRVIGAEPAAGDDAARSLRTRTLQRVENPRTIADGARTESLGALTFPLVLENVNDIVTVSDPEVVEAMRLLWERMKLVVEPTGALATAGVLTGRCDARGKRVGIILSGGNVDLKAAAALFA